jgi:D-sedoheptulose 7-phosphate isomerase
VSLPVAILAGGLATRLGEAARHTPKSLVDVAGKPFAARQLELLRDRGVSDVVFCLGHLGDRVEAAIGDGSAYGLRVRYSSDGERLLGTGGALRKAIPLLGDAFLVLYGDSYLECDYQAVAAAFLASGRDGLMTVFKNDDRWDRSNVELSDGRIVRYDKVNRTPEMRHIDYGLGALKARALDKYPTNCAYDLATVYQDLIADGGLAACEVTDRFYEIGAPDGLEETRRHLATRQARSYARQHLDETATIVAALDPDVIDRMAAMLAALRARGGRLFFLGVGGSAANCSHAVNDFRKIAGIEAYTPVDNVSELTARTNDEGWESVFVEWLKGSRLRKDDMVFVFSVGGGNLEKNISPNLVRALEYAREVGAEILGIVGRDGGHTAKVADACVIIPTVNPDNVTPHAEAFQPVIWHLLVSHPLVKAAQTKWESTR